MSKEVNIPSSGHTEDKLRPRCIQSCRRSGRGRHAPGNTAQPSSGGSRKERLGRAPALPFLKINTPKTKALPLALYRVLCVHEAKTSSQTRMCSGQEPSRRHLMPGQLSPPPLHVDGRSARGCADFNHCSFTRTTSWAC